jgi:hypothetical protein
MAFNPHADEVVVQFVLDVLWSVCPQRRLLSPCGNTLFNVWVGACVRACVRVCACVCVRACVRVCARARVYVCG